MSLGGAGLIGLKGKFLFSASGWEVLEANWGWWGGKMGGLRSPVLCPPCANPSVLLTRAALVCRHEP